MKIIDLDKVDVSWVASKSLRNCHAMGVDSLLFQDTPGNVIRAFVCRPEHELWMNSPSLEFTLSVGLHPHHCDVTLAPIYGEAYNVTHEAGHDNVMLQAYEYESAITGFAGSFTRLGFRRGFHLKMSLIEKPVSMTARDIHTIYVPKGQGAAWYVLEGKENPSYISVTYSNADLEAMDFTGMYQPMSADDVRQTIEAMKSGTFAAAEQP